MHLVEPAVYLKEVVQLRHEVAGDGPGASGLAGGALGQLNGNSLRLGAAIGLPLAVEVVHSG